MVYLHAAGPAATPAPTAAPRSQACTKPRCIAHHTHNSRGPGICALITQGISMGISMDLIQNINDISPVRFIVGTLLCGGRSKERQPFRMACHRQGRPVHFVAMDYLLEPSSKVENDETQDNKQCIQVSWEGGVQQDHHIHSFPALSF